MDDFRNKVIEELNKEVKTSNCKVELEYYDYFVDDLGNYYINTKFSGALRRIQERVCKAFDFISKPKIMRASELVLRSLEINAGPKLTFPEEIEPSHKDGRNQRINAQKNRKITYRSDHKIKKTPIKTAPE